MLDWRSGIVMPMAAVIVASAAMPAPAADRWQPIDGRSAARLPDPTRTEAITGAELACAEQRWSLDVELAAGTPGADGARQAEMRIGAERYLLEAERKSSAVSIAVPSEALQPLRAGIRMHIEVSGGEAVLAARFSLIGSRRAIDEIAPRCSKRDMSAYREIRPGELNPETTLARELLTEEIASFTAATRSAPRVAAALESIGDDRRLLFATLCGSSWYYGNSGCNMTVHAQQGDGEWKRVYETEGVTLHIDPNAATDGWPDLVALTFDGDEIVWHWENGEYLPPVQEELLGE